MKEAKSREAEVGSNREIICSTHNHSHTTNAWIRQNEAEAEKLWRLSEKLVNQEFDI